MDPVLVALWAGGFSGLLVIIAAGVITFANRESETIVLGFAALFGAYTVFGAQLFFHLRGSRVEEPVGTQVIINHTTQSANALQPANGVRADLEHAAAKWLAAKTPDAFKDSGKLARDLVAFSLLNYFANNEQDWQTQRRSYRFPAFGPDSSMTEFHRQQDDGGSSLSEADIRSALHNGRNLFADAPLKIPSVGLRLPAGSQFAVFESAPPTMRTTLALRNPISQIEFVISPTFVAGDMRPPSPGQKGIALGQGVLVGLPDATYSVYLMRIVVQASFAGTRAHHPDVGLHRAWVERLQQGIGSWFRSGQP